MIWQLMSWLDRRDMRRRGGPYLNTLALYGTYRCHHRSHVLGLRCLRHWAMDYRCAEHWDSCYDGCDR